MMYQPPRLLFSMVVLCLLTAISQATPPVLRDVTPRGLAIGQTTTLRFAGANLGGMPQLITSGLPLGDVKVESAEGNACTMVVTLAKGTPAGIYALRLATADGISEPVLVGVDALPQQMLVADQEVTIPTALTGNVTGSNIVTVSFAGKKDQRVVIDVESRRLAAKLQPIIRVLDERDAQIAWSNSMDAISGDARCVVQLPADGTYRVSVHDKLYRGTAPGHFRLKIGDLHFADFALPLGVMRGQQTQVQLIGDEATSQTKTTLQITPEAIPTGSSVVSAGSQVTGRAPAVTVSDHPELVETDQGDKPQAISAVPVAVSGRLLEAGETDRYELPVTPGEKLRIELHAARLGATLDGVLDILRENGQRLAGNDDQQGTSDPGLDFTVPGGVEKVVVSVRDMLGRGTERSVYRLSVTPLGQPDFSLKVEQSSLQIPSGQPTLAKVVAQRKGYKGPISLHLHGLPEGIQVAGAEIAAGSNTAWLQLTGNSEVGAGTCVIEGRSTGETILRRLADVPDSAIVSSQPHLRNELGWAITKPGPVSLAWNLHADAAVELGDVLASNVQLSRAEGATGDVRLSLLTNQIQPTKTVKNDKTKKDEVVDDVDRTLRIDGTPVIAAGADKAEVKLLIPGDLPDRSWDLVLKGELLSADKKSVLATAYAPLRTITTKNPLRLELATTEAVTAKAGMGETGKIHGKIHRSDGFNHPVDITLAGLPEGYSIEPLTVTADATDFEFPIRFASEAKAGELKNIRVRAIATIGQEDANRQVFSNAAAVTINVVTGEKPPE